MTTQFTRHFQRPVYFAIGAALLATSQGSASAQHFNNTEFLKLPEMQQKGFLDGTIQTLYQMAAQGSTETGQCIYDWYYSDKRKERNWLIMRSIEKYPDASPSVVIVALTERACGHYIRKEQNP